MIIAGVLFQCIGILLMGPSSLLGFEQDVRIMGAGQVLAGLTLPMMLIPSLPEMTDVVDVYYKQATADKKAMIFDFSSGLFNSFLGIG